MSAPANPLNLAICRCPFIPPTARRQGGPYLCRTVRRPLHHRGAGHYWRRDLTPGELQHASVAAASPGITAEPVFLAGQPKLSDGPLSVFWVSKPAELDAIFVAIGGGGLIAGIACYVKMLYPHVKVSMAAGRALGFAVRLLCRALKASWQSIVTHSAADKPLLTMHTHASASDHWRRASGRKRHGHVAGQGCARHAGQGRRLCRRRRREACKPGGRQCWLCRLTAPKRATAARFDTSLWR